MFEFQNPFAFIIILAIPVFYVLRHFKIFSRITFTAVLADWEGSQFEWNGKTQNFFSVFAKVLVWISFLSIVCALADPAITSQEKIYTSSGTDIIFVVDCSPSMAAKDMGGQTRIQAVKETINQTARMFDGMRYGIVVLGNEASVFLPPTTDFQAFQNRLDDIKPGILGNGSAIGDGICTAVYHLSSSTAPKKCIILLTDGENNAGEIHPETAAEIAYNNGIKIYVVGAGTRGIVPLDYTDPATGKVWSGSLDSNFNPSQLKKIASKTEGSYFEVSSALQLADTMELITRSENSLQKFIMRTTTKPLYEFFIAAGIILAALAWIIKRIFLKEIF